MTQYLNKPVNIPQIKPIENPERFHAPKYAEPGPLLMVGVCPACDEQGTQCRCPRDGTPFDCRCEVCSKVVVYSSDPAKKRTVRDFVFDNMSLFRREYRSFDGELMSWTSAEIMGLRSPHPADHHKVPFGHFNRPPLP